MIGRIRSLLDAPRGGESTRWVTSVRQVGFADEIPDRLSQGELVLVRAERGAPKWVVFECPCGRGHLVWLNLQRSQRPRWRVNGRGTHLTLRPSVAVGAPWGCHFWIRHGRVTWFVPTGRELD